MATLGVQSFVNIEVGTPEHLTSYRKIAIASWRHPRDPSTYSWVDLPVEAFEKFLEKVECETKPTLTHFVALGLERGLIPLSPYTRCPIIIGIGKPREAPVVRDGELQVERVVNISMTFDHRYADGAQGALVMRRFEKNLRQSRRLSGCICRRLICTYFGMVPPFLRSPSTSRGNNQCDVLTAVSKSHGSRFHHDADKLKWEAMRASAVKSPQATQ